MAISKSVSEIQAKSNSFTVGSLTAFHYEILVLLRILKTECTAHTINNKGFLLNLSLDIDQVRSGKIFL